MSKRMQRTQRPPLNRGNKQLVSVRGVVLDNGSPATNMVFLSLADSVASSAQDVAERTVALKSSIDAFVAEVKSA